MKTTDFKKGFLQGMVLAGVLVSFLCPALANAEDDVLIFNGTDSEIVTGLSAFDLNIDGSKPKTMEAWVNAGAFNEGGVFAIGPLGTNLQDFALRTLPGSNHWRFQVWGNDLDFLVAGSLDNWIHVALTYDGTTMRVFVNGGFITSRGASLNTSSTPTTGFRIGSWGNNHFRGSIRDVRVWSVARTAAEIQSTMNSSPVGQSGLQAWWPMNDGAGRVVNDESGNSHHATIMEAQWRSLQFQFDQVEADFIKDFGVGPGKVSELSLLRNRSEHWSLQEDTLRMRPVSDRLVSSGALASVTNRSAQQEFTLETEVRLTSFPGVSANQAGLIALGGPHTPVSAPFETAADEDFISFTFYPGTTQSLLTSRFPNITPALDGTAVIAISRGFNGPVLAAVPWQGRKPAQPVAIFWDGFEVPEADSEWLTGGAQAVWQIGAPSTGPAPESGVRVAATNLDSAISASSDDWLRSPVINLSDVSAASLVFREALNIDGFHNSETGGPYHNATVRVVDVNGGLIVVLGSYSGNSNGWRAASFPLPPEVLGQSVRVEFHIETDHLVSSDQFGWVIDDVAIESPKPDLDGYALKAKGVYNFLGDLDLSLTVTDLEEGSNHSQTISATAIRPPSGNLFGIGGRVRPTPLGSPEFDFAKLSMTLGDEVEFVASTTGLARFSYLFGSAVSRVGPERFATNDQGDWTLRDSALRLATSRPSGNSLATTRILDFKGRNPIQLKSDLVLATYNASAGGRVGLVLFGEEELTVLNPADSTTYYTFQYDVGAARIVFRKGMDGAILYEAPFTAGPAVGGTYSFLFSGRYNEGGVFEFTASIDNNNGGKASLSGTIAESLETRSRFGIGAAQGGGDVWDFMSFSGNTTGGQERFLVFNGVGDAIETGLMASALGIAGNSPKTVEAWVYTRSFNGGGIFQLGRSGTNNEDFALRTLPNEMNRWRANFWGGADVNFTAPVPTHNAWTHMALAYDGSMVRLYVNGQLAASASRNLNTQNHAAGMLIGRWANDFFHGAIRDVRIWNVSRFRFQIEETMNSSPLGGSGLLAWWPLEEGSGDIAHDHSGNNRHGVIIRPQWDRVGGSIGSGDPGTFRMARVVRDGTPVRLNWDATYASATLISGIGNVSQAGSMELLVPLGGVTTYTLNAADRFGIVASTPTAWVRSVPVDGFERVRYVKFEIPDGDAVRDPDEDAVQLSQFLFYRNGGRVDPVAIANPGGDNPGDGPASNLLGADPNTKWVDFNKGHLNGSHLVFDFGAVVEIDAYQLGTANDAAGRDPDRWRLYGRSSSAEAWRLIENMDLEYPLPDERLALTAAIPLAGPGFFGGGMTFNDWLDSFFTDPLDRNNPEISGRLATPAGDGVANILKYAFGLDPRIPVGSSELTQSELVGDKLRLIYPERVGASDISYQPEKSIDLAGWSGDGILEVLPRHRTEDGEFEWVTVEIEINGQASAFLRVKVLELE